MELHIYRSFLPFEEVVIFLCQFRPFKEARSEGLSSSEHGLPAPQVCNCAPELQYEWGMGRAGR